MNKIANALKTYYVPALMVLLSMVLIVMIFFSPIVQSIYLSFFQWNGIWQSPMKFIGLQNYVMMFKDQAFWTSIKNVLVFMGQGLLFQGPFAFILALFITKKRRSTRYFKFTFFLPVVIPLTAVAIIWKFVLNPNWGVVNNLIRIFFPSFNVDFIGNPGISIYSIVFVSAWVYVGLNMIIFSAGLTTIPAELYESAEIDGITGLKKIYYITLPLMMESIKIYMILMITGSLKAFDIVYVMTRGGPNEATMVPAVFMYVETFSYTKFGYGATIATFILVSGLIGSLIANKYLFTR